MPIRKVNGIAEFDHAPQKVRPRSKTFDDAGDLLPSRPGPPEVISRGGLSGGLGVFGDANFRGGLRGQLRGMRFEMTLGLIVFVIVLRHTALPAKQDQHYSGLSQTQEWMDQRTQSKSRPGFDLKGGSGDQSVSQSAEKNGVGGTVLFGWLHHQKRKEDCLRKPRELIPHRS
jgi:hypothetical protein